MYIVPFPQGLLLLHQSPDALDRHICLALPKILTKFVSVKFNVGEVWAHWDRSKYLLTTSVNHTAIKTITCILFAGKFTCEESWAYGDLKALWSNMLRLHSSFYHPWIRYTPAEAVSPCNMPVESSPCSSLFSHLHHFIAAQIWNIFGGRKVETLV